ncbi:tetratricopeptide repeat-containing sensor histidine kinase [Rhodohalobacter mucosus]|uniref:histidine kinase n=1 Tax=Rhodohalobacter mucosus TaxID=2079485 RepID=A0A316TT00_9BACT|nr:tetratricopeptide repeat-containing sensor histidine kinase [Rhodohalobacter mucosus]PWN07743.1 hypothetical protein DDZ15_01610 [Rhodohalobacter mucosus]
MYRSLITLSVLILPLSLQAQNERADSLRTHINPAVMEPSTVSSIADLSDILILNSELEEAKEWLLLGYEVAERIDDNDGKFSVLTGLSKYYLEKEMPDSVFIMTDQAALYADSPFQEGILQELKAEANSIQGNYVLAVERFGRASFLADSLGNYERKAGIAIKSADAWSALGDDTEALRAYYEALEFADQADDSAFIAAASNLVGWKFLDMDNPEQAEYFLVRAEEISRAKQLSEILQSTLLNLGNLYRDLSDFGRAETYYVEALELSDQRMDTQIRIRLYHNLGVMERERGNYQEAMRLLLFAFEESRNQGDAESEYYTAAALGELEMERDNRVQAIRWYARANLAVENEGYATLRLSSYDNLYRAYRKAGNYSESLRWLEERDRLQDSLETADKARLLAEYETLFNVKQTLEQSDDLREREQEAQALVQLQQWLIILAMIAGGILLVAALVLVKSNQKRKKVNEKLQASNRQLNEMNSTVQEQNEELEQINDIKNKLFAIIAHDLRGPLSSLQSLIYLVRDHDLSQAEMAEITKTLERNLQENASMMDNLLAWAQAQMNGIKLNVRDFPLHQGVKSVTDQIQFQAEKKGVILDLDVPKAIEVKADYDMVKLVVRNLVANAIKFSEKEDSVRIKAFRSELDGMAEIHVIDEGTGIREQDQKKLFSKNHFTKRGTDNEKGSGLGLMLCKEFIEGHGGSLWFESKSGIGTTFMFTIPLSQSSQSNDQESSVQSSAKRPKAEKPVFEKT